MNSILFFLFSLLFYSSCTEYFIVKIQEKAEKTPIIDIFHNLLFIKDYYLSDIMIVSQGLFTLLFVDYSEFEDICFIMAMTQILRSILSTVSILPPLKKYSDKNRVFGILGSGKEYIFSGHASYAALSTIYLIKKNVVNIFLLSLYNLISNMIIIFTRNHYTVDVLLSWIIVPSLWYNLHLYKRLEHCDKN